MGSALSTGGEYALLHGAVCGAMVRTVCASAAATRFRAATAASAGGSAGAKAGGRCEDGVQPVLTRARAASAAPSA